MKLKLFIILTAALGLTACAFFASNTGQAALNTAAEGITTTIIADHPGDAAALKSIATALPTLLGTTAAASTPASLSAIVSKLAAGTSLTPASQLKFAGWFDGVVRNANSYLGGSGGTDSIAGAVANQFLQVVSSGMLSGVALAASQPGAGG
jgi:hypothetical protein